MNINNVVNLAVAAVCGFLGGMLASHDRVQAASLGVVRASAFQLVNQSGAVVSSWKSDSRDGSDLEFGPTSAPAIRLGVLAVGRPFVQIRGRDGKKRIVMELNEDDKPVLAMSDDRWEGRVILGWTGPDAPSSPDDGSWGLSFLTFGSTRTVAGIGTTTRKQDGVDHVVNFITLGSTTLTSLPQTASTK